MDSRLSKLERREKKSKRKNNVNEDIYDDVEPLKVNEDIYDDIDPLKVEEDSENLSLIEEFSDKEQKLREALGRFKKVSKSLKSMRLNSKVKSEEIPAAQLTKLVEALTTKMKLEELKVSVDLAFGKGKKIKIVKNDIGEMINSLEEVVEELSDSQSEEEL